MPKHNNRHTKCRLKQMGLQAARAYAEAAALLEPFGAKALHLRLLAEFVTARKN